MSKQEAETEDGDVSNYAVVRQKIPVVNNVKHVQKFKTAYDRCFEKFHDKMLEQYAFMQE